MNQCGNEQNLGGNVKYVENQDGDAGNQRWKRKYSGRNDTE